MKITGNLKFYGKYSLVTIPKDGDQCRIKFFEPNVSNRFVEQNLVYNDDEYGMYVEVRNPYRAEHPESDIFLTDNDLDLLLQALKDGYCDSFMQNGVGMFGVVHLYQHISNKLRAKTLDGWKDVNDFKYAIKVTYMMSASFLSDDNGILLFETKDDAEKWANDNMICTDNINIIKLSESVNITGKIEE